MKRIVITAIYFISLINAADDTKEIELELGSLPKRIFKGYTLDKKENTFASFVGIHQTTRFTIIRAEYRTDKECVFGTKGGYEEVTFDHSGFQGQYSCWDGYHYSSSPIESNYSKEVDKKSMQKALSLCSFYFKIHAQRTLGLENRSTS